MKKKQKEIIVHTVYAFAPSMKTAVATKTMICDLYVIFFNLYRGILVRKTTNKHQKVYKKGWSLESIELLKSKDFFWHIST